jgi:hypothetical protein
MAAPRTNNMFPTMEPAIDASTTSRSRLAGRRAMISSAALPLDCSLDAWPAIYPLENASPERVCPIRDWVGQPL